ncbi:MAG: DUF1674 domain-containing protein [Rhodanobacteraceae bacterium]|nr:DUF1674 domain-containing protein [Rhodanobacteraceae bacterium]
MTASTDPTPADGEHPGYTREPAPDVPLTQGRVREFGGRAGPDPTRYGDWEKNGRCIDF